MMAASMDRNKRKFSQLSIDSSDFPYETKLPSDEEIENFWFESTGKHNTWTCRCGSVITSNFPLGKYDSMKNHVFNEHSEYLEVMKLHEEFIDANSDDFHGTLQLTIAGKTINISDLGISSPRKHVPNRVRMKERLVFLSKLGMGASGTVYKALDLQKMSLVAIKCIKIYDRIRKKQMISELRAWYTLLHDNTESSGFVANEANVVDFYDAYSSPEDSTVSFILEYMSAGSLQNFVDQGGIQDEKILAKIAAQIIQGLRFLHGSGQLHRDLKPANILMSDSGVIKISDLGLMKELNEDDLDEYQRKRSTTYLGTATFMSPERLDGKEYWFPADIWSFGITLMTLALGRTPFETSNGYWKMLSSIKDTPLEKLPKHFSASFQDFLDKCLVREPEQRWDSNQLLSHPFLTENVKFNDLLVDFETPSVDEARNDLRKILEATYLHIQSIQQGQSNLNQRPDISNYSFFNDFSGIEIKDIIEKLFMNDIGIINEVGEANIVSHPRLWRLAKQLHLSLDEAVAECQFFFNSR